MGECWHSNPSNAYKPQLAPSNRVICRLPRQCPQEQQHSLHYLNVLRSVRRCLAFRTLSLFVSLREPQCGQTYPDLQNLPNHTHTHTPSHAHTRTLTHSHNPFQLWTGTLATPPSTARAAALRALPTTATHSVAAATRTLRHAHTITLSLALSLPLSLSLSHAHAHAHTRTLIQTHDPLSLDPLQL